MHLSSVMYWHWMDLQPTHRSVCCTHNRNIWTALFINGEKLVTARCDSPGEVKVFVYLNLPLQSQPTRGRALCTRCVVRSVVVCPHLQKSQKASPLKKSDHAMLIIHHDRVWMIKAVRNCFVWKDLSLSIILACLLLHRYTSRSPPPIHQSLVL